MLHIFEMEMMVIFPGVEPIPDTAAVSSFHLEFTLHKPLTFLFSCHKVGHLKP